METIKTSKALFRRLIWVVQSLGDKLQLVSATIKSRKMKAGLEKSCHCGDI